MISIIYISIIKCDLWSYKLTYLWSYKLCDLWSVKYTYLTFGQLTIDNVLLIDFLF
jgi:hypothetical protein